MTIAEVGFVVVGMLVFAALCEIALQLKRIADAAEVPRYMVDNQPISLREWQDDHR